MLQRLRPKNSQSAWLYLILICTSSPRVFIDGELSDNLTVEIDFTQVSILGPILYCLIVHDLPKVAHSHPPDKFQLSFGRHPNLEFNNPTTDMQTDHPTGSLATASVTGVKLITTMENYHPTGSSAMAFVTGVKLNTTTSSPTILLEELLLNLWRNILLCWLQLIQ